MRRDLNIIKTSGTFVLYAYIIRCEQMFVNGFGRKTQTFVRGFLLFTHTCPVTEFAVASHLNTANSCCHHVFLRHFRFQKCLPVYSNKIITVRAYVPSNENFHIFPFRAFSCFPETVILDSEAETLTYRAVSRKIEQATHLQIYHIE